MPSRSRKPAREAHRFDANRTGRREVHESHQTASDTMTSATTDTMQRRTSDADEAIDGKGYAHPDALVSTDWLAARLEDPTLRILESDEDVLLYHTGHIPGAQKIDWHEDLNDPVTRDYVGRE